MSAIQMAVLLMVAGGSSTYVFNQTITADTQNYNLRSAALAAGWNGTDPLQATVTVNSGIYVGATGTGFYGFDTGASFPAGTTLALVNNGFVVGCGGAGGSDGANGAPGGPALLAQAAITITNNGTIGGGGGGGGGGGPVSYNGEIDTYGGGGGGGRGYSGGAGGSGFSGLGTAGTKTTAGTGGAAGSGGAGAGGNGGGLGAAGSPGNVGTDLVVGGGIAGGAGGAAGAAVVGNSNITWAATGTRLGSIT